MGNELEPEAVHWLDLGPDPDLDGDRHPRGHWRWWYVLVPAMVVAALLLTRNQHITRPLAVPAPPTAAAAASPSPTGTTAAASPLLGSDSSPRQADSTLFGASGSPATGSPATGSPATGLGAAGPSAVTVTKLGHPLLAVPADWELFGQGPGIVVRMQLRLGRVTRTSVPEVGSSSSIFFVVGPDRVIVHPMDSAPGYVVHDGKPATQLPPALDQATSALPGPDPRHVWAETETGTATALSLLTLDGQPAGIQIPLPKDTRVQASDRAGNVLMFGVGGMYDLRRDGMHRITSGTLLAVGPTRWLTFECDARYRCGSVLIDRATGTRRTVHASLEAYEQNAGSISPDGRTAALLRPNRLGASSVHLLDLSTGADRLTGVATSSNQTLGGRTFVWSPDSRWLFVADGAGRVLAVDRAGRVIALDVQVGAIDQLALRTASR